MTADHADPAGWVPLTGPGMGIIDEVNQRSSVNVCRSSRA